MHERFSKLPQIIQVSARELPSTATKHSLLKLQSNIIEDKKRHKKRDKLIDPLSCINKQEKSIPTSKEKERTFLAQQKEGEKGIFMENVKVPSIVLIPTLGIINDLQGCGASVFDLGQSSVHHKDPDVLGQSSVHHKDPDVLNNPNSNFNVCSDIKHLHPLVNPEPLWVQLFS